MFLNYVKSFNVLSENDLRDFMSLVERRSYNKNECLVKEGEKCTEIAFLETGIFRTYYLGDDGKEMTYCFRFPGDLVASYSSYISGKPSKESIQAICDAKMILFQKSRLEEMFNDNPNWIKFLKIIAEQEYLELEKRFFQLQRDSASARYNELITMQPQLYQRNPIAVFSIIPRHHPKTFEPDTERSFFLDKCPVQGYKDAVVL